MTVDLIAKKELMKEWINNHSIGSFVLPEDIARLFLFLTSPESAFITGTILSVDGVYTV